MKLSPIFLGTLIFLATAVQGCRSIGQAEGSLEKPSQKHATLTSSWVGEGSSLYELKKPLINTQNQSVSLDLFRGSPVLISMFYSSCGYTCPLLIENLKKIESRLSLSERARVKFLLISFDPDRDSPATLNTLMQRYNLDRARWALLSGKENDLREIAALLGTQYRKMQDASFNHSSQITLVDEQGKIVSQFEGLNNPEAVLAYLRH